MFTLFCCLPLVAVAATLLLLLFVVAVVAVVAVAVVAVVVVECCCCFNIVGSWVVGCWLLKGCVSMLSLPLSLLLSLVTS